MDQETLKVALPALSAVAAIASAISAALSWWVARGTTEFNRHAANVQSASKYEELIAVHPGLLDLHGFSHKNLQQLGLTQVEVAYLISSFTAGDLFYRDGHIKELTKYRQVLLQSSRVQSAWKQVLKGKFILEGPFSTMVDAYIETNPHTRP
jgi:hypothetical protein